jgi:hypothetical protein
VIDENHPGQQKGAHHFNHLCRGRCVCVERSERVGQCEWVVNERAWVNVESG